VSDARPFSTATIRAGDGAPDGMLDETFDPAPGGTFGLALGAPETVLAMVESDGAAAAAADRKAAFEPGAWLARLDEGAAAGERMVALARRDGSGPWRMRALIGFADPLRPGIREAMAMAAGAGIQALIVTGDHPRTAAAIAREAGLAADHVVTGDQVAGWSDEHLAEILPRLHVVARSVPEGKDRLVRVARAAGRTVAVTGDGVNDAPALHRADVAVAMGSGSAVAREASDLVLGDDSFATLMFGLAEGRRIVDNVQKGLVFLVSTHVALLGFILIATLAGFGQPLLPIQILWLELFIDTSTSIAFEREAAEPGLMRRAPRRPDRPLLTNGLLARIAVAGGFSAVAALAVMLASPGGPDHARWLAYTALVAGQCVRAYANRSLTAPLHRLGTNGFLLAACVTVLMIQAVIPLVPPLAEAFRAAPLGGADWALVAAIALGPAILAQAVRVVRPGVTWVA
jgi:Ca2+-transporting ATPase